MIFSSSRNVLLIIPPNITFEAFISPTKNSKSWRHSNGKDYGVLITDVPLGILTISAFLKKEFNCNVRVIDYNTEIHKSWDHPTENNFNNWFQESLNKITSDDFKPDII
jgi:hypothetical protein